ncbi:MAG: hypothetical protein HRF45_00950 [Fimbriimonadia bacterium]
MISRPGLLLLALLVAGCGSVRGPNDNSAALPDNGPVSSQPRLTFQDGEVLRYSLTHDTKYSLTGEIAPSPVEMHISFTAMQVHTVADIEGFRARLEVRLEDVKLANGDDALARRIAGQVATLRVAPTGIAEARHSEPGKGPGAPASVAYLGVALPDRRLQPFDRWDAQLSFPVGRLLGRVVPEEHVIPVTIHYTIETPKELGRVLRYSGNADFSYEHAAERAVGRLQVHGFTKLTRDGSRVSFNEESATVTAEIAMAGASGFVRVVTSSNLRLP